MKLFQHPVTGEHVHASKEAAEQLIEEGWHEVKQGMYEAAETPAAPPAPPAPPVPPAPPAPAPPAPVPPGGETPGGETPAGETPAGDATIAPPEKPLGEMAMAELVAYAEKIGMSDPAALKKHGSSKAKAAEAITAYIASKQA